MIPLALITGFLGSGKTTLLGRVIERHRGRRLAYLVNEFSSLDVDGRLLAAEGESIVCLPGGSIFCRCLVTSFIRQLREIAERHDRPDQPLEGLIVEASGIADPRVVGRMLKETRLDHLYRLTSVISIVDPGSFLVLRDTLPNIAAQIEASHLAIVNKVDLFSEARLVEVEAAVREIHPAIEIIRSTFCSIDLDPFASRAARPIHGEYAPCADPHYAKVVWKAERPVDVDRLLARIREAGSDIYRAKGFVYTGDETLYIDVSAAETTARTATEGASCTELALIVRPGSEESVRLLLS
ncbi:MAG TPA: GTP-binding protein [Phycisphaerae bacterium]|nr:GTP-binding protein [Phycisphaerae bacterium]HRY69990.1 GTP-binding protein [Phycisphaerae bacterium]HSA27199.1 GTP-binding protein [Phycisphaerae bacterium]